MKEYTLAEEDFIKVVDYIMRNRLRWTYLLLLMPPFVLLEDGLTQKGYIGMAVLYAFAIVFLIMLPKIVRAVWRKGYRDNAIYHKPQSFEIEEDEIRLASENGSSRYKFKELTKIEVLPDFVLIWPATTFYHVLPTKALQEHELKKLRSQSQA